MQISEKGFGPAGASGSAPGGARNFGPEWHPLTEGIFGEAGKIKIGVVGMSQGAGATFVASRIAYTLAQECDGVCFVEAADGAAAGSERGTLAIHSLSMSRVFKEERFADYFGNWKQGLGVGIRTNMFENVNWVLRSPYHSPNQKTEGLAPSPAQSSDLDFFGIGGSQVAERATMQPMFLGIGTDARGGRIDRRRSVNIRIPYEKIPGRYMIVDTPPMESLQEMDLVVCVTDPLPSKLIAGEDIIRSIRENRIRTGRGFAPAMNIPTPCLWVLNKDNSRVRHRQLEKYMKVKFDFAIPMLDLEEFYRAEYSGMPIFKAIMRPGGNEANGRAKAAIETEALAARIQKLLPIL